MIGYSNVSPSEAFFENPYFLKKEEIKSFSQLWNRLQKINDEQPQLEFPLTQFTRAFEERASKEFSDAIVDYMIALESLVFYEESRSVEPAGKVIGIAIGMLLGNNQDERTEIKETLIKAYEIRNAKVHGNLEKLQKYGSNIEKLSIDVEDYLRRVLRRFVGE